MEEGNRKRARPNKRLRAAREQRGWSQAVLADLVGTTELSIGRWERGERSPQLVYRARLCDLFGMTAEELGLVEIPESPTTKEAGLVEPVERPTELEAPQPSTFPSISSVSSPPETGPLSGRPRERGEDAPVLLPHSSLESRSETQPLLSPRWPKRRRSRRFLGIGLFGLALVIAVTVYSLHLLFTPAPSAFSTRFHAAMSSPTPLPLWRFWPQVLNDALLATDYDQTWEVDQNSPPVPGPRYGICNFSPISHTYQLQSFGANYCAYGSGHEHPWTDLAYSIELSIRQGTWGGLVIRLHQNNFYYFNITTTGTYELLVHQNSNGGQNTDVVTGSSAAIHRGLNQWNTLLIAARGPFFQLWINGTYVTSATDRAVTMGTIGVSVSYGNGYGAPLSVAWFRHAQVWRPAESS